MDTPLRVRSPGTEPHISPLGVRGGVRAGDQRFLITSPELQMKRLLVEGSGPIFQITHVFRGGEQGPLHQPEFCMLEWYQPGTDYRGMMDDTEALLGFLVTRLGLPRRVTWRGRSVDIGVAAERITVEQAFLRHASLPPPVPTTPEAEERFFRILVEQVEPKLGLGRPSFLIDYPACQASLARVRPGPHPVAERAELYLAGVELCNAFTELTCPREQRQRVEQEIAQRRERGLGELPPDTRFLEALDRGMPASGGNALGVDRLVMLLAGANSVAEVMAFPEEQ